MANVLLTPGELKGKRPLPKCCLVCGASDATRVETAFALQAGNKWSLATGHVSVMRYLTVMLPLCKEHKTYFTSKQWRIVFLFAGVMLFFVAMLIVSVISGLILGANAVYVIVPVALLAILLLFGFIGLMMWTSSTGVHANAITQDGLRLSNVAGEFADLLQELRDAQTEEDDTILEEFAEDDRPHRRGRR